MPDYGITLKMTDASTRPLTPLRNISGWVAVFWFFAIFTAMTLRIFASMGDLWLDEIWSIYIVRELSHSWEIFTAEIALIGNNHILNTLYIFFAKGPETFIKYRWLSIITGAALVMLMGRAALGKSRFEAVIAISLGVISYPLIQFSSEARGYGPAMFFSVACFILIQTWWNQKKTWGLALFWCSAILGFLSHLTFAYVYVSIAAWSVVHEARTRRSVRPVLGGLVLCHALPLAFASGLFLTFFQKLGFDGNRIFDFSTVILEALQFPLASPKKGLAGIMIACAGVFIITYGIYRLYAEKSGKTAFFFFIFLPGPAIFTWFGPSHLFQVKYTVLCIPFFYLLLAHILYYWFKKGFSGKILCILATCLVCYGNMAPTTALIKNGRGHYYEAVNYMAAHTQKKNIVVGSDHDFRNMMMLWYYGRFVRPEKNIDYVSQDKLATKPPQWLILHGFKDQPRPAPGIKAPDGKTYLLAKTFPYTGFSGFNWYVYKMDE